jgi:hypothetical protein
MDFLTLVAALAAGIAAGNLGSTLALRALDRWRWRREEMEREYETGPNLYSGRG